MSFDTLISTSHPLQSQKSMTPAESSNADRLSSTQQTSQQMLSEDDQAGRLAWYHYLIAILALVAVGVYVWEEILEDRFVPRNWGVVEDGAIYRSGQISPWLIESMLVDHQIKQIIDLNGIDTGKTGEFQKAEITAAQRLGIELSRYPLKGDGTGDIQQYAHAISKIVDCQKKGEPVLVHCAAGAQRTGGVIASYRMLVEHKTPQEAVEELCVYESRRHKNKTVVDYVNTHLSELASILQERGVIEDLPASPLTMSLE